MTTLCFVLIIKKYYLFLSPISINILGRFYIYILIETIVYHDII